MQKSETDVSASGDIVGSGLDALRACLKVLKRLRRDIKWLGVIEIGTMGNAVSEIPTGDNMTDPPVHFRRRRNGVEAQLRTTTPVSAPLNRMFGKREKLALPHPGLVRLSVRTPGGQTCRVSIILRALTASGTEAGRLTLPITEQRDWLIDIPSDIASLSPALRIAESGVIRPFKVKLHHALEGEVPPATSFGISKTDPSSIAQKLYDTRRYDEVLNLQRRPWAQLQPVNRLAFASLVQLREFERAVRFHTRWAPVGVAAGGWERQLLEALGNLGRWRAIRGRLEEYLAAPPGTDRTQKLIRSLPYASDEFRARMMTALETDPDHLPSGERAVIDAANRAAFDSAGADHPLIDFALKDNRLGTDERLLLGANLALARQDELGAMRRLNDMLSLHDLSPIQSDGPLRIDTLTGAAELSREPFPLVSVIMTAFNSAATIGYAVRSLARQSYQNLEIIVVDDCSTDDTAIVAEQAAVGRDLRIIRAERNQGTYKCRNAGLAVARGRYVLNQDSDDWAHPQKIERLMETIRARPNCVAAWSHALRLTPDRGFLPRGGFIGMDGTSLMFPREEALREVGFYDEVRAGADGEYHRRMEMRFGSAAIAVCDAPLSIIAARPTSLSRSGRQAIDPGTGVFSSERNAYRRAYLRRHARQAASSTTWTASYKAEGST